jgi:phosphoesterase RecJ-like protein
VHGDVDAIGSVLALSKQLEKLKIPHKICVEERSKKEFSFLPGAEKLITEISDKDDFDTAIILDTATFKRITHYEFIEANRKSLFVINIDHHQDNKQYGDINIIKESSSVGEALFEVFKAFEWEIDVDTANCLYAAIIGDTGGFRYNNVTKETMRIAAELVALGAKNYYLSQQVFEHKEFEVFDMIRIALNNLVINWELGFAYTYLPESTEDYGHEVIDFIRMLKNIDVFLVFRKRPENLVQISLRSKYKFDVSQFAKQFNGGGHKHAAAIRANDTLEKTINNVITKLSENLKANG